jgi:hypothetical protein
MVRYGKFKVCSELEVADRAVVMWWQHFGKGLLFDLTLVMHESDGAAWGNDSGHVSDPVVSNSTSNPVLIHTCHSRVLMPWSATVSCNQCIHFNRHKPRRPIDSGYSPYPAEHHVT